MPRLKEQIEARLHALEMPAPAPAEAAEIDVAWVKHQHFQQYHECKAVGDRTNARENLTCLGKAVGAYDTTLHLDVVVQHQYDERLAVEASRLARIALEDLYERGLEQLPDRTEPAQAQAQSPDSAGSTPSLDGDIGQGHEPVSILGQLVASGAVLGQAQGTGMDSSSAAPEPEQGMDSGGPVSDLSSPAPEPEPEPDRASMLSGATPKPPATPGPRCE